MVPGSLAWHQTGPRNLQTRVIMPTVTESAAWRVVLRAVMLVFALVLLLFLVRELRAVLVQLALAILLAAAANPLVERLTSSTNARRSRWRPARGLAALFVFIGAVLVLTVGVVIVLATVAPDLQALAVSAPL